MKLEGVYGIDVYWLPLGAGGWFVRGNGLLFERILARREHRSPLDLYHSALEVRVPEGRFVIEDAWPIPDAEGSSRGVVVEGPVWSPHLARLRTFRYEVRRWREGRIPDVAYAVASPQHVSDDVQQARRLLELVRFLPPLRWGRDEVGIGDMWNSNSVVSWLLTRAGIDADRIQPPLRGRAPGWHAGVVIAGHGAPATATVGALGNEHSGRLNEERGIASSEGPGEEGILSGVMGVCPSFRSRSA